MGGGGCFSNGGASFLSGGIPHGGGGGMGFDGGFQKTSLDGGAPSPPSTNPTTGNAVGGELPKNGGLDSLQIYGSGVGKKEGV